MMVNNRLTGVNRGIQFRRSVLVGPNPLIHRSNTDSHYAKTMWYRFSAVTCRCLSLPMFGEVNIG